MTDQPLPKIDCKPDYTHPWHIMGRRLLKEKIFEAMKASPSPFPDNSGMAVCIFGSTVLYIYQFEGYDLPFPKKKSHDLDLAIYNPNGYRIDAAVVSDYFQNIFKKVEAKNIGRAKDDGRKSTDPDFVGNIYLEYQLTDEDKAKIIAENREMAYIIQPETNAILLDVEIYPDTPPTFLNPLNMKYFEGSQTPVVVDDIRNVIAKKLARSASNPRNFSYKHDVTHFKPRDLVDIFNAFYSTPWLINYDTNKPNNDVELMRTMFIINCLMMGKPLEGVSLAAFDATKENITKYQEGIGGGISVIMDMNDPLVQDIFRCVQKILKNICPELEHGKGVQLTKEEQVFVEALHGYTHKNGRHGLLEPSINASLIVSSALKERHPELTGLVNGDTALGKICRNIMDVRMNIGDF